MSELRYAADKPKECRFCYYWSGKNKCCELGKENCYYLLPDKKPAKEKSDYDGCPYGRVNPCIGYCLRNIMQEHNQKKEAVRRESDNK